MGIRDWHLRTIRLFWVIDLGAFIVLSAPYMVNGGYARRVGDLPYSNHLCMWLLCSFPLCLVTWIWLSSRRPKRKERPMAIVRCSFCSKSSKQVQNLFDGPNNEVHICDDCLDVCVDILSDREKWPEKTGEPAKPAGAVLQCSFCNKNQEEVGQLIAGPDVYICNDCVARFREGSG
jgi:hypothetical protein